VEATATVLVPNYARITHDCMACRSWDINSVTLPQSLRTEKRWRVILFGFVLRWISRWLATLVSTAVRAFHLEANGWLLGQRMISYYRICLQGLTRGMATWREWLIQQCLTACWLAQDKSVEQSGTGCTQVYMLSWCLCCCLIVYHFRYLQAWLHKFLLHHFEYLICLVRTSV